LIPRFSPNLEQVYSPWLRAWKVYLDAHPECFAEVPAIVANTPATRTMEAFSPLFDITIPHAIPGYELEDEERMEQLWPAGTAAAREILHRFVSHKCRIGQLDVSPLNKGGVNVLGKGAMVGKGKGDTRIGRYNQDRDTADRDSSSRISPYLASGVISIRELIRETIRFLGVKKVDVSKENGPGFWVTELGGFLDFSVSNN
jgi:deoxyribodipyrimidine photo-lyase